MDQDWKKSSVIESFLHFVSSNPGYLHCRIPCMREQLLRFDTPGKYVHDMGTGPGTFARMAKSLGAKYVLGTDISQPMLELARAWPADASSNVDEYASCCATDILEGNKAKFDIITAAYLFIAAKDTGELYSMAESMYDQLKPGGALITYGCSGDLDRVKTVTYDQWLKYGVGMKTVEDKSADEGYITLQMNYHAERGCGKAATYAMCRVFANRIMEEVFQKAGFRTMEWIDAQVSNEGMERYGSQYWEDYLLPMPIEVLFIAIK